MDQPWEKAAKKRKLQLALSGRIVVESEVQTPIAVRFEDSDKPYRVTHPITYHFGNYKHVVKPFNYDGASIPALVTIVGTIAGILLVSWRSKAWWRHLAKPIGSRWRHLISAAPHDDAYQTGCIPRWIADAEYAAMLVAAGVHPCVARAEFYMLRLCGGKAWRRHRGRDK